MVRQGNLPAMNSTVAHPAEIPVKGKENQEYKGYIRLWNRVGNQGDREHPMDHASYLRT